MNRRRFIKTALGAAVAFLFTPWRDDDDLQPLSPHLVMNGYDTMPEGAEKWQPKLVQESEPVLKIDRLSGGAEYMYYVYPDEVG